MLNFDTLSRPQVMFQFGDGEHAFVLKDGATLIDLAQSIDGLEAQHGGAPISIQIAFGPRNTTTLPAQIHDTHPH